jgi:hypothetical protein
MDTLPDQILRADDFMEDAARYVASVLGDRSALAATTYATTTHGPATRVDRICLSTELLDSVRSFEVVPVPGLSDHHITVLRIDPARLVELLHELVAQAEANSLYAPA